MAIPASLDDDLEHRVQEMGRRLIAAFLCSILLAALLLFLAAFSPYIQPALAAPLANPGWDDADIDTAFEPGNRRGNDPLGTRRDALDSQGGKKAYWAGNSNFQVQAPVVDLPGRGLDLSLTLYL